MAINRVDYDGQTLIDISDTTATDADVLAGAYFYNSAGVRTLGVATVNDASLAIQVNGVTVATFTANASSNVTAGITVPTTAADVGAVPTNRTVNGKALSVDITLSASDVGAVSSTTTVGTIGLTHCTEVTAGDCHLRKQGNVVMLYLNIKPDSSVNNNAFLNSLVTLPTGFRPAKTLVIQSAYPNDKDIRLYLQPSGACNLYNASGAAITTNQQIMFSCTFVG